MQLTKSEKALIKGIRQHDAQNLASALQIVFDISLYQSAVLLDRREKNALYEQNWIIRELEKMKE